MHSQEMNIAEEVTNEHDTVGEITDSLQKSSELSVVIPTDDEDVAESSATTPENSSEDDTMGSGQVKEHIGRWTQEEHELFIQGIRLHDKQWKLIADLIKTRTVVQIRTHAQKYFQKLQKTKGNAGTAGDVDTDGHIMSFRTTSSAESSPREKSKRSFSAMSNEDEEPNSGVSRGDGRLWGRVDSDDNTTTEEDSYLFSRQRGDAKRKVTLSSRYLDSTESLRTAKSGDTRRRSNFLGATSLEGRSRKANGDSSKTSGNARRRGSTSDAISAGYFGPVMNIRGGVISNNFNQHNMELQHASVGGGFTPYHEGLSMMDTSTDAYNEMLDINDWFPVSSGHTTTPHINGTDDAARLQRKRAFTHPTDAFASLMDGLSVMNGIEEDPLVNAWGSFVDYMPTTTTNAHSSSSSGYNSSSTSDASSTSTSSLSSSNSSASSSHSSFAHIYDKAMSVEAVPTAASQSLRYPDAIIENEHRGIFKISTPPQQSQPSHLLARASPSSPSSSYPRLNIDTKLSGFDRDRSDSDAYTSTDETDAQSCSVRSASEDSPRYSSASVSDGCDSGDSTPLLKEPSFMTKPVVRIKSSASLHGDYFDSFSDMVFDEDTQNMLSLLQTA